MEKCGKRAGRNEGTALEPPRREAVCLENAPALAPLRACSACAGDYEDPDRTAGMFEEAGWEESDESLDRGKEEFPADDY